MTRKATSIFSCSVSPVLPALRAACEPYFLPLSFSISSKIGRKIRSRSWRSCVGEIGEVLRALDDGGDALEAHAGIDVRAGSGEKVPSGLALNWMKTRFQISMQRGVAGVDQRAAGVAGGREIDVHLGARTARAGVAHHPEVVFLVAVDDVDGGIEPGGCGIARAQMVVRFLVELGSGRLGPGW